MPDTHVALEQKAVHLETSEFVVLLSSVFFWGGAGSSGHGLQIYTQHRL